jgi:hypothetical protein
VFFVDLIFALVIAFLFALILSALFRRRGPGPAGGFIFILLLLFLFIWAGGVWVYPIGPMAWETPWLAFVVIGVVFALLLGAALPPAERAPGPRKEGEVSAVAPAVVALSIFFWLLVLGLIALVIIGYAIEFRPAAAA